MFVSVLVFMCSRMVFGVLLLVVVLWVSGMKWVIVLGLLSMKW